MPVNGNGIGDGGRKGPEIGAWRRAPEEPGAGCRGAGRHGANQQALTRMAEITRPRGTSRGEGISMPHWSSPDRVRGPFQTRAPAIKAPMIPKAPVINSTHAASVAKRLRQRLVVPPYGGSIPLARPVATTPHPWFVHGVVFCWRRAPAGSNREGGDSAPLRLRQRGPQPAAAAQPCRRSSSRDSPPARTGSWQGRPVRAAIASRAAAA